MRSLSKPAAAAGNADARMVEAPQPRSRYLRLTEPATSLRIALAQVNTTVGDMRVTLPSSARDRPLPGWRGRSRGLPRADYRANRPRTVAPVTLRARLCKALESWPPRRGHRRVVGFRSRTLPSTTRQRSSRRGGPAVYRKMLLPTRGLRRAALLRAAQSPAMIEVGGVLVGLTICEDIGPGAARLS